MRLFLLIFSLFASHACFADSFPTSAAAKDFATKVMSKVATGDIQAGLTMMKPYTIVPPAEFDVLVEKTSLQLPAITQ